MSMRMPFGKYRGLLVNELPYGYLNWLIENIDLREPLRSAVFWSLNQRKAESGSECLPGEATLKGVYRRLAQKWHPDHGGSTEAMQALNEFYSVIKSFANT